MTGIFQFMITMGMILPNGIYRVRYIPRADSGSGPNSPKDFQLYASKNLGKRTSVSKIWGRGLITNLLNFWYLLKIKVIPYQTPRVDRKSI